MTAFFSLYLERENHAMTFERRGWIGKLLTIARNQDRDWYIEGFFRNQRVRVAQSKGA